MIDSIDRYYRYRSFDYLIKIKIVFRRSWAFFRRHSQKTAKIKRILLTFWLIDRYYRFSVYRWIDGHRLEKAFYDRLSIQSIKNKKSLMDGSITSMKMRPKVSIDTIGIDPSLIVPIYASHVMYTMIHKTHGSYIRMKQHSYCRILITRNLVSNHILYLIVKYRKCLHLCLLCHRLSFSIDFDRDPFPLHPQRVAKAEQWSTFGWSEGTLALKGLYHRFRIR